MKAICGACGTKKSDPETGYCINNHDYWVELQDFDNPDLVDYIKIACRNLGLSEKQLKAKLTPRYRKDSIPKEVLDAVWNDLDGNDMLNIFGMVNIGALKARVGEPLRPYSDRIVKNIVKRLFDPSTIGGVKFIELRR